MHKKSILYTILGIVFILALSGCFSHRFEVQHNPDGSGLLIVETIFTQDYLGLFDDVQTMDEAQDDILADSIFTRENLPDDPNIGSVQESDYIDETTGSLHHSIEIEILDILTPVYFEDEEDLSNIFLVEAYDDGTFLFTANLESLAEQIDEDEEEDLMMDPEMFRFMLQGSTVVYELHVAEFIEGDPLAVYDPASNTVTWEVPMYDVLFGEEPLELFAIYRVDTTAPAEPAEPTEPAEPEPVEPEPEEEIMPPPDPDTEDTEPRPPVDTEFEEPTAGLFGLPNWVPLVLLAVLCLGGILVVVAVVVIILIARKRKQNQP